MNRLTRWILQEAWIIALELALVAALALSLAYWTWVALSPATLASPAHPAGLGEDRVGPIANRNLFGTAQAGGAASARGAGLGIAVLGVFSGRRPGEGRAILARQGSRPATVAAGEAIADGLVLHEVYPDHVIVLRDGVPERVELERRVLRQAAPAARAQVRP